MIAYARIGLTEWFMESWGFFDDDDKWTLRNNIVRLVKI